MTPTAPVDREKLFDKVEAHLRKLDAYQWEGAADIDPQPLLQEIAHALRAPAPADWMGAQEELTNADDCFEAALCEGWTDAVANGDIDAIRDLYYRRIEYARGHIQRAAAILAESVALAHAPARPAADGVALADVAAERRRQIEVEGWTAEHDAAYEDGVLASAGASYALQAHHRGYSNLGPETWPFPDKWWKPKSQRRDLVRAAALIIAEIDRLDRALTPTPAGSEKGE